MTIAPNRRPVRIQRRRTRGRELFDLDSLHGYAEAQGYREALMALEEHPDLTLRDNPFPVGTEAFAGWKRAWIDARRAA